MPLRLPTSHTHAREDLRASFSDFKSLPAETWPDDCPRCGHRMRFAFEPAPHRLCPCGVRVAVLAGRLTTLEPAKEAA